MLIKLHRWLGLLLSVIVLSISLSGVMLLWKKEYLWLDLAQARQAIHTGNEEYAKVIRIIENQYAKDEVQLIQLHSNKLSLHKAFLSGQRYAWHDQQGVKIQVWRGNQRFEDFLLDWHHRFLMGNSVGLNIAGISGLLVLLLALAGLVIWWPRRHTIRSGFIPHNWQRAAIIRSHGNLGVVSIVGIFLTAITGVILVYPEQSRNLLLPAGPETSLSAPAKEKLDDIHGVDNASWLRTIERSRKLYPNSRLRWVSPPSDKYPYRTAGLQQSASWNPSGYTMVYININTGRMDGNTDALAKPVAQRLFDLNYPLHTGALGLWYRLLLSLFGLAIAALCLLGISSYSRR